MRNSAGQFLPGNIPAHKTNITFICAGCKQETKRYPYQTWRVFCSVKCRLENNAKFVKCNNCGKEKKVFENELKKKTHFCDYKCYWEYKKGKSNTAILGDKHPMKNPYHKVKITLARMKKLSWSGNERAIHQYIQFHYGKADRCENPKCDGSSKNYDWSNISYGYLRDRFDWEQLCRKCHMAKDREYREKIAKNTTSVFDKKGHRIKK